MAFSPLAEQAANPCGVLLTGGVGVGKTTVAIEVGVLLTRQGIANAVIDLDWMSWGAPSFDGDAANHRRELLLENLRDVWRNYQRHGVRRAVLAGSITSRSHLEAIRHALADLPLEVVRVCVTPRVALERVQRRDPASKTVGSLSDLRAFEDRVDAARLESRVVHNETSDPTTAALEVAANWNTTETARA